MANNQQKYVETCDNFVKTPSLKDQPCKEEVFLKSEFVELNYFGNEMKVTNSYDTDRMIKVEKKVNTKDFKQINSTEPKLESCNNQPMDVYGHLKTSCNDLKNVISSKMKLKREEVNEESWSQSSECAGKFLDIKRESSTTTTKLTKHAPLTKESVKRVAKKYTNLSISVSGNSDHRVVLQRFNLDSNVTKKNDEFLTTTNVENHCKLEPQDQGYTSDSNTKEKQKSYDPLLKQQVPLARELNSVENLKESDIKLELECDTLFAPVDKVKENIIERKEINESGSESDHSFESNDDDGLKTSHPNRRLQTERPVSGLESGNKKSRKTKKRYSNLCDLERQEIKKCKLSGGFEDIRRSKKAYQSWSRPQVKTLKSSSAVNNVIEKSINKNEDEKIVIKKKSKSAAEYWTQVLCTPELWQTECISGIELDTSNQGECEANYHEQLSSFVSSDCVKNFKSDCLTFWESKFQEKLKQTNANLLLQFYIPPAQVELFYLLLTDDLSCVECLRRVCENRHWLQPTYKQIPQTDTSAGFVYRCELNEYVQFTPLKPASNHELAQELAAHMCLEWLGLRLRKASKSFKTVKPFQPSTAAQTN